MLRIYQSLCAIPAHLCSPDSLNGVGLAYLFRALNEFRQIDFTSFSAGSCNEIYLAHTLKMVIHHPFLYVRLLLGGVAFPCQMLALVQFFHEVCMLHIESDIQCKLNTDSLRHAMSIIAETTPHHLNSSETLQSRLARQTPGHRCQYAQLFPLATDV